MDVYRRAFCRGRDDDVGEVFQRADKGLAADEHLLPALLDVAATCRAVVALQRLEQVGEDEPARRQRLGPHGHLVRAQLSTEAVDLDHAGDGAKTRRHLPVEDVAKLHGGVSVATDFELIDLPEPGRNRPHLGLAVALGDGLARLAQPLTEHLTRPPDLRSLLEDNGDDREPEARQRAHLLDLGDAAHGLFHGHREEAFNLLGTQPRRLGQDLDLYVGDVGNGVDRQLKDGAEPRHRHDEHEDEDERAVAQRPRQDPVDEIGASAVEERVSVHGLPPSPPWRAHSSG